MKFYLELRESLNEICIKLAEFILSLLMKIDSIRREMCQLPSSFLSAEAETGLCQSTCCFLHSRALSLVRLLLLTFATFLPKGAAKVSALSDRSQAGMTTEASVTHSPRKWLRPIDNVISLMATTLRQLKKNSLPCLPFLFKLESALMNEAHTYQRTNIKCPRNQPRLGWFSSAQRRTTRM
jgi:hypothetical protein